MYETKSISNVDWKRHFDCTGTILYIDKSLSWVVPPMGGGAADFENISMCMETQSILNADKKRHFPYC